MKIAWIQVSSLPKEYSKKRELSNLIYSKTSSYSEVFLFFTQLPPKEDVVEAQNLASKLPGHVHVLVPVCSHESKTQDAIKLLCSKYKSNQNYNEGTVQEIGELTHKELVNSNIDCFKKISQVKGSFHFYGSEDFGGGDGSLFALYLNTSVSTTETDGESLLFPRGIDLGFADSALERVLNKSKIGIAFGEKGSSLWIEQERNQLINYVTYNGKISLYLCSGETARVIPHQSRWLGGNFNEIQIDSDSCVIGFVDFSCNTGAAVHYTYDSVDLKWEKDNNFACSCSVAGITDAVIYPSLNMSQIQTGMRDEIISFANVILNASSPAVHIIDWEVDSSQSNDSYLRLLADAFFDEISQKTISKETCIYVRMRGNVVECRRAQGGSLAEKYRFFIFQNCIGFDVLPPSELINTIPIPNRILDNSATIFLRVLKRGDKPLPKAMKIIKRDGSELPVEYKSISFAWLNHLLLVFSMFWESEKYANPQKQKELAFAISDDNLTTIATQDIHPANEFGNISEKQENVDLYNQATRRRDDAEKGDDRDGR